MASGEGPLPLRTCATANETAAASTAGGEESTVKACSSKRKETEEDAVAEQLPHPPTKHCPTGGNQGEEDAGVGSAAKKKPPRPENLMSTRQIRWILNYKPMTWPRKLEELRESNPSLVPRPGEEVDDAKMKLYSQANEILSMDERYQKLQVWVRHELETKGYVEMDDDRMRRKAECNRIVEELREKLEVVLPYLTVEEDDDESECESCDDDDDEEFYF